MSSSTTSAPSERVNGDVSLGNHEARLRALERRLLLTGWRFNVFNGDDGETPHGFGWLQTDESVDHGYGELGFLLVDKSEKGITLLAINAGNTIQAVINITYDGGISIATTSGASVDIDADGSLSAGIANGKDFTLSGTGGPMLRMTDGSPDLHIPTGGSVIADL